jgi:hypothetical protein
MAEASAKGRMSPLELTLAALKKQQMDEAGQSAQAPTQTVAEKLLNPQAPPPPMGGIGAPSPMPQQGMPAGLGATPEAAQAPMPEMGAPEMPMEEAPMGMAAGGLTTLPLPDTMFDEPNNGSYAGGGIVAFAGGGYGKYFEDVATKAVPGLGVTSRQRSDAENTAAGGVSNSFHKTDNARDFVPPKGMSMAAFHQKLKGEFGSQYDVINEGDHVHVEPGPGLAKSGSQGLLNPSQAANPRTPTDAPGGSLADQMMPAFERAGEFYDKFMPKPKTEARDKLKAHVEEGMSEESQKKQKNYDKWSALAEAGWAIAGSNSPNFFQAVAEGGKVATASGKKAKEEREARFEKYLSQYAEIEGIENNEARQRVAFMLDFGKTELDLTYKDMSRTDSWRQALMQNETTKAGQNLNYNANIYSTNKNFQASVLGDAAKAAQLEEGRINDAVKLASADVQQDMKYRNGTPAEKDAIFKARVQAILAAMPSSGSGGTGSASTAPWDRNYGGQ